MARRQLAKSATDVLEGTGSYVKNNYFKIEYGESVFAIFDVPEDFGDLYLLKTHRPYVPNRDVASTLPFRHTIGCRQDTHGDYNCPICQAHFDAIRDLNETQDDFEGSVAEFKAWQDGVASRNISVNGWNDKKKSKDRPKGTAKGNTPFNSKTTLALSLFNLGTRENEIWTATSQSVIGEFKRLYEEDKMFSDVVYKITKIGNKNKPAETRYEIVMATEEELAGFNVEETLELVERDVDLFAWEGENKGAPIEVPTHADMETIGQKVYDWCIGLLPEEEEVKEEADVQVTAEANGDFADDDSDNF